jgi:type II secretory pathway component PulJ
MCKILTHEQKLQKIEELNNQIKILEKDVVLPAARDLKEAEKQGFSVFRILPR